MALPEESQGRSELEPPEITTPGSSPPPPCRALARLGLINSGYKIADVHRDRGKLGGAKPRCSSGLRSTFGTKKLGEGGMAGRMPAPQGSDPEASSGLGRVGGGV